MTPKANMPNKRNNRYTGVHGGYNLLNFKVHHEENERALAQDQGSQNSSMVGEEELMRSHP